MTESVFSSQINQVTPGNLATGSDPQASAVSSSANPLIQNRIQGLVWKITIATLLLMAVGSATRVMNAGLACPDWPLCYGQLVPSQQMNLQVFLEWFHRLDAALIGLSTLLLVGITWWQRQHLPRWLPWAATFALSLILFQGVLGGLTVTELLRFDIVTAHLGTALLFFCTLLAIAAMLLPYQGTGTAGKLSIWGGIAVILVYLQCLLGGLVGSQWALHQCFGYGELCAVMNSHLWGVLPASLSSAIVAIGAWRTPGLHPYLRRLSRLVSILLLSQIALGYATFKLHLQVEPLTVAHHTLGAALVGTLVVFTVLAWRDRSPTITTIKPISQSLVA
ncbi:MAG: heme A synthase [Coleofasciculaceae cyanobacterium SM2_1_6]|nr:heme A synthase [Coleofasciculaceae cyanobacterium SM2_1_6]